MGDNEEMSRASTPGGRFNSDFEIQSNSNGIDADLKRPVGSNLLMYLYDPDNSSVDPIYDVGDNVPAGGAIGKIWKGPFSIPTIRTVITQGSVKISQYGFYNADSLHITLNAVDIEKVAPGTMMNPDDLGRCRIVWKEEIWRPYTVQQSGIVSETFLLLTFDCIQVMPEEMVNDPQFLQYAN
jgi:hypothetical protein